MGAWRREEGEAYRDEDAVCVFGLAALVCTHEVGQARDVVDAHHVDVVVEAERLDEREVDLQRDVALVLVVGGEHAERHAVRIAAGGGERREDTRSAHVHVVLATREVLRIKAKTGNK